MLSRARRCKHVQFARHALNVDFMGPTLDSLVTFTRAAANLNVVNVFDVNGVMQNPGTNVPRFEFDQTTHMPLGLLMEEARSNVCMRNSAFSNGAWMRAACTVGTDTVIDFAGTSTYDTLTATAANALCRQTVTGLTVGDTYTFALDVKRNTGTGNIQISLNGTTFTTIPVTAQWGRPSIQAVVPAGGSITIAIRITTSGDAISVGMVQVEKGLFPTSRISSAGVVNLRPQDFASIALPATIWHDQEFTVAFNFQLIAGATAAPTTLLRISGSSANAADSIVLSLSAGLTPRGEINIGGTNMAITEALPAITAGTIVKVALSMGARGLRVACNGKVTDHVAAPRQTIPMTTIDIGPASGAGCLYARRLKVWRKPMSAGRLAAITA